MAKLFVKIDTLDKHPRVEIFDTAGKQVSFALEYVNGQGEGAKGGFDTYSANVKPGAYWVVVFGDLHTRLLKATVTEDVREDSSDPVIIMGGPLKDADWVAMKQDFLRHEIPQVIRDKFVDRASEASKN